jgi:hypothetical protein
MEPVKIGRDRKRKEARGVSAARGGTARRASTVQPAARTFSTRLMAAQTTAIRKELDDLLIQIETQSKDIENSLTFDSLKAYKELVRKFVHIIVHELYEVEEKISVSPTGRKKSMLLVKKIDEKLEQLSDDFIKKQSNLIDFMARLDDIRGLLMDLYS